MRGCELADEKGTESVGGALTDARRRLAPSDTAALDAQVLLAHVLGTSRAWILAHPDAAVSAEDARSFQGLTARRAQGVPVAYLRGWVEWFGMILEVGPDVLVPRPETELLVEAAVDMARRRGSERIADIGTGSGAIAIAVARALPGAQVMASDVSAAALRVAACNVERLASGRVTLHHGSLLAPLPQGADLIVANLPYLSDAMMADLDRDVRHEPPSALHAGATGLELYDDLVAEADGSLAAVLFEIDPRQAALARELWGRRGLRILRDYAGRERIAILERL